MTDLNAKSEIAATEGKIPRCKIGTWGTQIRLTPLGPGHPPTGESDLIRIDPVD